jgi:hypothetical protein
MEGVKESNGVLCKKFGIALGELGAIDPEQLQIISKAPEHQDYTDTQMGVELIKRYLVQAYRKAPNGNLFLSPPLSFLTSCGLLRSPSASFGLLQSPSASSPPFPSLLYSSVLLSLLPPSPVLYVTPIAPSFRPYGPPSSLL